MSAVVARLRERGVEVLFVRPPSTGPFLEFEKRLYPRATTWDVLLASSGAPGIHFEDYPELQQFDLPEWSHLSHADAKRFTAALHEIIARDFWRQDERTSDAHWLRDGKKGKRGDGGNCLGVITSAPWLVGRADLASPPGSG